MPSFTTDKIENIVDFIIPMTWNIAGQMMASLEDTTDAAIYWTHKDGTKMKTRVTIDKESNGAGKFWYCVNIDEYHPRKDGVAQHIFKEGK
jgi:hypothetical protein